MAASRSTTAAPGAWSGAPASSGFDDLRSYLQARCDTGVSIPSLAQELGVSDWTVKQALHAQGVVLPPRPQRLARQRRRYTDQRIAARVAELGFADVRA
jgi:hypothetical protein